MMIFNIELPKKINKFNYFKKNEEGGCTLYSFNGGVGNTQFIIAKYSELEIENDFAVVDSTLNAIVKLNPNVEVKLNEKSIVATSQKGKYIGKYINEECPTPYMEYNKTLPIDLEVLVKASQFVSNNEKKPILTGVNVNENGVVIATDSFKIYRYNNDNGVENPTSITIPAKLIMLADSLFTNKLLFLKYNKNSFCISDNNISLVGQLLDGNYPVVAGIFNKLNQEPCTINKNELLEAIDFTKITGANVDTKKVPIYVTLSKNHFIGKSDEMFEKDISYNGDEVVFDALFFETVLKSFNEDEINIATLKRERGSMSKFFGNNANEQIVLLGIAKETK